MLTPKTQPYEQLMGASWFPFSDEPVIKGLWYVPRLSSPVFLFPEESPDGKWHLFAHSWLGIQHYVSDSGIMWEPMGVVQVRGKYPFLFKEKGTFHIIYERHGRQIPFVERFTGRMKKSHLVGSHIEMRSSNDLSVWSEPRILIDSKEVPLADDYMKQRYVAHPQLILTEGGYRLYIGSSKYSKNPSSSRYLFSFFAKKFEGPYLLESPKPIIEAVPNDKWRSLASGRISIYKGSDKYYALQNPRYWDSIRKKEASAIVLLLSEDGLNFKRFERQPILTPTEKGWASDHIISCDVKYKSDEDCWYCYYTASGEKRFGFVREEIGLLIGKSVIKKS